jgi:beta-galactosidase
MQTSTRLHFGAAYYPEHWPEAHWAEDIRMMREAGMTVIRMAEFAWSTMEPTEGKFDFGWLDRAIESLADAGMVSVLGTPTAAPPAWLTQSHPEISSVDAHGIRVQHGRRCHYCVNSPEFHKATQRIVAAMGEHFGHNPHVIGWQIDNEYNNVCYCNHCQSLFQQYLAERFKSLDELNVHWATRYWSQTYSAWDQIPIPIGKHHNPGLELAFHQFVTESYRRFQRLQLDTLRPHLLPDVWVTHNFMKWFDQFDHYVIAQDLDLASWDWYIGTGHFDYREEGAAHDLVRGYKRQNFWLMETQPGCVNWSAVNNTLNKGEMRTMAWHAVAHGADALLYWQWRPATNGQEQYHGSLIDQSGQPRPIYQEVQNLGLEFAKVSTLLAGSTPAPAKVAILNSYDCRWSIAGQPHHEEFDYKKHLLHYYRPFATQNIPVDIIQAGSSLEQYQLVIAPALTIIDQETVKSFQNWLRYNKYLILTIRSGMKDEYNGLLPTRQPGPLNDFTGTEVEEFYALDKDVPVAGNWFKGHSQIWAERLKPNRDIVSPAAKYGTSNGWLDDQFAITVNVHRSGLVYYVGVYLDDAAQQAFINRVIKTTGLKPTMSMPLGVEVQKRIGDDEKDIFIIINHERKPQVIELPWPAYEHLTDTPLDKALKLAPYGILILTQLDE